MSCTFGAAGALMASNWAISSSSVLGPLASAFPINSTSLPWPAPADAWASSSRPIARGVWWCFDVVFQWSGAPTYAWTAVGPLAEALAPYRRLIVVPHGALHYLPFQALYDGAAYLIDYDQVSHAWSVEAKLVPAR